MSSRHRFPFCICIGFQSILMNLLRSSTCKICTIRQITRFLNENSNNNRVEFHSALALLYNNHTNQPNTFDIISSAFKLFKEYQKVLCNIIITFVFIFKWQIECTTCNFGRVYLFAGFCGLAECVLWISSIKKNK